MAELELAANISQFVIYGKILISSAIQIYQSASGVAQENAEIELAAENFAKSREKLKKYVDDSCDETLLQLCRLSNDIAHDLLEELNKLKIPSKDDRSGSRQKLLCFWAATKGAWKKDYIQAQKKRLEYLEKEIIAYVTVDHRDRFLQYTDSNSKDLEKLSLQGKSVLDAVTKNANIIEAVRHGVEDPIKNLQDESSQIYQDRCLEKLPVATSAQFNSYERRHRSSCLPHTREETLRDIRNWVHGDDEKSIFWLNGLAGTGKSTIANSIANEYYENKHLAGSFFFSKDIGGDVTRARKFFTTLARQLARVSDETHKQVSEVIARDETIVDQALLVQWRKLILEPLLNIGKKSTPTTLLFVVDALDECEDVEDIESIVGALAESRNVTMLRLRILLTSRSYFNIRQGFREIPKTNYEDFILHDISRKIVDRDISILVRTRFKAIQVRRQFGAEWPSMEKIDAIIQRAYGLFIWADTACRFVEEGGMFVNRRLDKLLEGDNYKIAPEKRLDSLYLTVLEESISPKNITFDEEELEEYCDLLRAALGAIATMFASVSVPSLGRLTDIAVMEISDCLERLGAILDIREERHSPVRLHHPSFRDFLLNQNRCTDKRFVVDETKAHADLACYCMDVLSSELRRNMCDIRQPGRLIKDVPKMLIEQCVSEALQYACQYWAYHLHRSEIANEIHNQCETSLKLKAYNVLQAHLTHWLEALSLIGRISESIHSIKLLEAITPKTSEAIGFVHDARRFIQSNIQIIELAPLQVYCASLLFAPQRSLVRNQFQNEIPRGMQCLTELDEEWSAAYQSLEGHTSAVKLLDFSADGKRLLTMSDDKTFTHWDLSTGQVLQLSRYEEGIPYVEIAFSIFNELLATYTPKELKIWDLATGLQLKTLKDSFSHVTFSNDGKLLASSGDNDTISLWDTASGGRKSILVGQLAAYQPSNLIFSPECNYLAWKCFSRTDEKGYIELGNINSPGDANLTKFLEVAKSLFTFSINETHLILGLWGGRIDIVALQTMETSQTLQTARDVPDPVLSPTYELLFVKIKEGHDEVWDLNTLTKRLELNDKSEDWALYAAFSPDGTRLAAVRHKKILLWDLYTGQLLLTIIDLNVDGTTVIHISHDNKLLAAGFYDGTIRLWDIGARDCLQVIQNLPDNDDEGYYDDDPLFWIEHIITVENLDLSIVPCKDGGIDISSFEKGKYSRKVQANDGELIGLEYFRSQDRELLISLSSNAIRLWDILSGKEVIPRKENEGVIDIKISPSGKYLVFVSLDQFAIYDIALNKELQTMPLTDSYEYISCSANDKYVAVTCEDSLELWDLDGSKTIYTRTVDGIFDELASEKVAFTSASDAIAYAMKDGKVGIRHIPTEEERVILSQYGQYANALAFSPDDSLLAISYDHVPLFDCTIAFHSVDTGELCAMFTASGTQVGTMFETRPPYFSDDGQYLNYFWGQLCLGCLSWDLPSEKRPKCKGKGLVVDGSWVMQGLEKVLWLPSRYRSRRVRAHDDILLMQHDYRRLTKLRIDVHRDDFWDM